MPQRPKGPFFAEDITLGTGATYATGGMSLSVQEATQVDKVIAVTQLYGAGTIGLVGFPELVQGSESGQSFKVALVGAGAANTGELANASTAVKSTSWRVYYLGS